MHILLRGYLFAVPLAAAVLAAGCSGGVNTTPLITSNSAFSVSQTVSITSVGSPLTLPSSGAFGGSLTLSAAAIPAGEQLTETLTNTRPASDPVLQAIARGGSRTAQSVVAGSQILYVLLTSSQTFAQTSPPAFTLTLPAADITAGTTYYLALYDPTQPQLGWQEGYAGPATINGTALTFTPAEGGFTFAAGAQYAFGVYANSGTAPASSAVVLTSSATQTFVGTAQTFTASEAGYAGAFAAGATCTNGAGSSGTVGTVTPASATPASAGAPVTFTFNPQNPGSCTVTVGGASGFTGTIQFNVNATNLGVN